VFVGLVSVYVALLAAVGHADITVAYLVMWGLVFTYSRPARRRRRQRAAPLSPPTAKRGGQSIDHGPAGGIVSIPLLGRGDRHE
jgi:hypothetical protein